MQRLGRQWDVEVHGNARRWMCSVDLTRGSICSSASRLHSPLEPSHLVLFANAKVVLENSIQKM
jgi:hypothetical protein